MSLLSVYLAPGHQRPGDLDYIRRLQPNVIRILEPDVNDIAKCHAVAPNAIIQPRYWWLDDGNREQYAAMVRDPVGTGKRHAAEWARELSRLHREASERQLKIPLDLLATGCNEPDTNQAEIQIVEYTRVFLSELAEQGIQGGALCLSVGHPTRLKANGRVDWSAYMALEDVIVQGRHYVVLHEYMQQEGPFHGDDWGYLAGRHHDCPFQAPIIIGEAGIDGAIYNRHPRNTGWREFVSSEHFAAMVRDYCNRVDDRVQGVCLFLTDYKDNFWASFDTEPAHGALLAVKDQIKEAKPVAWGIPGPVVPRPQPGETGTTMWVNSPDGLKVRSGPGVNHAQVGGLEHGASVTVYEVTGENQPWARVDTGWVAHWLLSDRPPAPVVVQPKPPVEPTPPMPSGIIDPLAGQAIIQIESGGQGFGPGNRLLIRFENHLFNRQTNNAYTQLFQHGDPPWTGHQWRRSTSEAWQTVHTGNQANEWMAFEFASSLNRHAALQSISMGAPQVLGSHFRRLGYATPEAMFRAFGDPSYGMAAQMLGFVNFFLSDTRLFEAMRNKDFLTVATIYNGPGQAQHYANLMRQAYERLR